jgi:hypothetical protein
MVEYLSREKWLSKTEALLPSNGLKFYTDGSLFNGMVSSGVFQKNLFSSNTLLLELTPLFLRLKFTPFWCFFDCCLSGEMICNSSDSQAALLSLSS